MNLRTIDIKGSPYVKVNERLKFFRAFFPGWSLDSEIINMQDGVVTIKAVIRDENGIIKASGTAQEKDGTTYINKTSYIENCETSAWGRALANLGIGIDGDVCSADERITANLNNGKRDMSNETLCECCGSPLFDFTDVDGDSHTVAELISVTNQVFHQDLCYSCYLEKKRERLKHAGK